MDVSTSVARFFVFCGVVAGRWSTSAQSLVLDGGDWSDEPSIPRSADRPGVACAHNSIFLLNIYKNELLQLDLDRNVWNRKKSIHGENYKYDGTRMISIDDELLIG